MRKLFLVFLLSACLSGYKLAAQHNLYEFGSGNYTSSEEETGVPLTDPGIFLIPLGESGSVFDKLALYNFSFVRFNPRGYDRSLTGTYFTGLDLTSSVTMSTDYALVNSLRRFGLPVVNRSLGTVAGTAGRAGYNTDIISDFSRMRMGTSLAVTGMTDRNLLTLRAASVGRIGDNMNYAVHGMRRWGNGMSVDGVFNDETNLTALLTRTISTGHRLTAVAHGQLREYSSRSYAVAEAFELTGDNLYNPSWGWYGGRRKSGRVNERKDASVFIIYEGRAGAGTRINAAGSFRYLDSALGSLSWNDAETPYPDYYRYMPGYASTTAVWEILTDKWKNRDPATTQIDWERLYRQNLMCPQGTRYLIEQRVSRSAVLSFTGSGTTSLGHGASLTYGLSYVRDNTAFYKRIKDLLGGEPFYDLDYFSAEAVMDSEVPGGGRLRNDIRHPERKVGTGDKFGYNYNILSEDVGIFVTYELGLGGLRLNPSLGVGHRNYRRRGNYHKEGWDESESFGRSRRIGFDQYTFRLPVGYSFDTRHHIGMGIVASNRAPDYGNVFISPYYLNKTARDIRTESLLSGEITYGLVLDRVKMSVAGYYSESANTTEIYRYYDDLSAKYCDMIMSGGATRSYGIEIGLETSLADRVTFSAAGYCGSYTFTKDPKVDIFAEEDMGAIISGSKSYMKGYRTGLVPSRGFTAELNYNPSGWIITARYSGLGGRYVVPSPVRRMERVYTLAGSDERFTEFVAQEKLGVASTVNLFVLRSFRIGSSWLSAYVSVDNILNNKKTVYGGYEQMRVMRRGSDPQVYTPFPNKYLYNTGRTFAASVSYRF